MADKHDILSVLRDVQSGGLTPEDALLRLKLAPFEDLGYAKVDYHRAVRQGVAEVIYGQSKTTDQILGILHAMEIGAENIYIVGATGTRMDHTMANIGLLKVCCDKGVNAWIEDDHNLITMISEGRQINKIEGYDYISFVPYGGVVTGVTLTGFEYNVQDRTFEIADSLGISNKIVSDDAQIEMEQGYMIVNYSTD